MNKFDLAVIGGGPGGYVAAIRASRLGAGVCLIERDRLGGTCLNRGCIPSKSLLSTVSALKTIKAAAGFGIDLNGEAAPNMARIRERTKKIVGNMEKGIQHLLNTNGVTLIHGSASFSSANQILVQDANGDSRTVEARKVVIATGTSPGVLSLFQGVGAWSTDTVFSMSEIPSSVTIIGGGVAGCEFATIFSGLGSDVAVVELEPQILPSEETEIVKVLTREFKKKKVRLFCGRMVVDAKARGALKSVRLEGGEEIVSQEILVTVGREPNTSGLGLDVIGLETDPKGNVRVNEKMETSVSGVYAVGDVTGRWLLAHVASKEGMVAVENALGEESAMDYSAIPTAVFTDPEIGSVGLGADEAEKMGIKVRVGSFYIRALGKAQVLGRPAGVVRLIAEEESGRLLGARIIGSSASELIHEATLAIRKQLTVQDLADTVHSHPTLSEAIMEAAWDADGRAVHA